MARLSGVLVVKAAEAIETAGITYRQFDYWWRMGWVGDGSEPGSGGRRDLDEAQLVRLRRLAALVNTGLRPDLAASLLDNAEISRRGKATITLNKVKIVVAA